MRAALILVAVAAGTLAAALAWHLLFGWFHG